MMVSDPRFVHLKVHSKFSILEGILDINKIAKTCLDLEMPAVALTDTNNMFAALEFAEGCSSKGIQPIQGLQVHIKIRDNHLNPHSPDDTAPIVLLAQNQIGYQNLLQLNSRMYLDQEKVFPYLTLDELKACQEGLICLTGGSEGPPGVYLHDGSYADAKKIVSELMAIFPAGIYQEIQRHS
ncbi:MAG: PHP domain-containing protein [Rhodobacteraceae bacterium]|nr:PHP domain-containing protein [Paracoccaceae bacterium]